jgi:ADP-L-glycero-D-manno-heptose 6-epimerase
MNNLVSSGYKIPFHTLEEGVKDYVQNYLIDNKYY